jgi:hypothetical protein
MGKRKYRSKELIIIRPKEAVGQEHDEGTEGDGGILEVT